MLKSLLDRTRRSPLSPVALVLCSAAAVVLLGFALAPADAARTPGAEEVPPPRFGAEAAAISPAVAGLIARYEALPAGSPLEPRLRQRIADQAHLTLYGSAGQDDDLERRFPSANTCATCHPQHFEEWAVSQHAYAQISPVFNAMHGTILQFSNGTNGDFCIRCHTPVGMNLGEPEFMSNMDRHPTSREGITCIVCHRLKNAYSKVSGRLALVEGDLFDAVYGSMGDDILQEAIDDPNIIVQTQRGQAGRAVHTSAVEFEQITESAFCGTCHDVNLVNGFRLEEAFSEYKNAPASQRGVSCQDCHMGKVQGVDAGYATGPAAVVGGIPTPERGKITSHLFAGPDYSIVHPGIFPHNARAAEMATIREWLTFDVDAGWGTDAFENDVPEGVAFPERWQYPDDRYEARDVIDGNLALLSLIREKRYEVLRAGYRLGDVAVDRAGPDGIRFQVEVANGTDGHNVPTGFDAERLVFLQVTVTDADGRVVFTSGDRDPNGDVRDLHSIYVHNGELPLDKYLFNLQSNFITRMVQGGEREQVLALNYSPSPLPFLRPSTSSTLLLGRPTGVRKHRKTIPPLQSKRPAYEVSRAQLRGSRPPYRANVKLIAQMVPVNLLAEIQHVGFDYFMSPREVADGIVEGAMTLYERDVELR